jgi:hypothetical protein
MRRLIRIHPRPQQCSDVGGGLGVVTPGRVGAVTAVDAAIVDLGEWLQQSGDGGLR